MPLLAAIYIAQVKEEGVETAILGSPQLCAYFMQIILSRGVGAFGAAEQ